MNLKTWLQAKRGRSKALADLLDVTPGRITQMADDGVPPGRMLAVSSFTRGQVTLKSLLEDRTRAAKAA